MKTFTTELATYEIRTKDERRVDGFTDGQPNWIESTTFRVFKDGKLLTVCYDESDLEFVIDCQERSARYTGMNSRLD